MGGGGQPFEVYLQVLEELAARWAAVAVAVSVHSLACHPLLIYGDEEQRRRWLTEMLGGTLIGAYRLSEPDAGSDAGALRCQAVRTADGYKITGTKAWITHGGVADFYTLCRSFCVSGGSGAPTSPSRTTTHESGSSKRRRRVSLSVDRVERR